MIEFFFSLILILQNNSLYWIFWKSSCLFSIPRYQQYNSVWVFLIKKNTPPQNEKCLKKWWKYEILDSYLFKVFFLYYCFKKNIFLKIEGFWSILTNFFLYLFFISSIVDEKWHLCLKNIQNFLIIWMIFFRRGLRWVGTYVASDMLCFAYTFSILVAAQRVQVHPDLWWVAHFKSCLLDVIL